MGVGGQSYAPAASTPRKDPVPILQEAGWVPRAGLDGRKISFPPGFDLGPSSPQSVDQDARYECENDGISIQLEPQSDWRFHEDMQNSFTVCIL